jgi:hypothetical protein
MLRNDRRKRREENSEKSKNVMWRIFEYREIWRETREM